MKGVLLTLSLLLVAGCSDHYRYPCQDPANWKKEECNRPTCEADGMCWDTLSGVNPSKLKNDKQTEEVAAEQAVAEQIVEEKHPTEEQPNESGE